MAYVLSIGDVLASPRELAEKAATGELSQFNSRAAKNELDAELQLSSGAIRADRLAQPTTTRPGWTPIGLGKPLGMQIRSVYIGDLSYR